MLRKILSGLLVAAALFAVVSCTKKEPTKIVIATDATWPPMEMVDENKAIVGFDIDLMNAAAKAGGFSVEFRNTAWDGIFAGLDNGNYDAVMSSVSITDDRKKTMDFSVPYINAGQIVVVPSATTGIEALADIKNAKVGAQIGTTGAFEIDKIKDANKIEEKTYDDIGLAFADLVNGRLAAVVCDTPVAAQYALQSVDYKGKLKIVGKALTEEYYGVAVKKGNTKVLNTINAGLKKVIDSGESKTIETKWLR
jgi:polar amino acid transport system substrate-binding protein